MASDEMRGMLASLRGRVRRQGEAVTRGQHLTVGVGLLKLKRFWSSSVCSVAVPVTCCEGSEERGAVEDLDDADA